ncbi:MAG TPA: hypothetical protein VGI92_13015 [Gemmatimonadales bacterium]|jgi:peptide chain release factor subunit 1
MAVTANRSSSKRANAPTRQRAAQPRSRGDVVTADVPSALAELLALEGDGWIVSCYQKLEAGDRDGNKYRIKLKNRLRLAADRMDVLGFAHADRETVKDALERIEQFFQNHENLAGARGVAVFAGKGWLRAIKLPHVLKSRVMVDKTPVVGELVALTEAGNSILVALADRVSARIFEVDLEGVREIEGLVSPDAARTTHYHEEKGAPGQGEYRFHSRIREEKHRHFAHVADEVERALRRHPYDALVLGGIGVDADAILPHLGSAARDKMIGVLRLAPKQVTPAEIKERAGELWADASEHAAADSLGELEGLKASGWAVDGVEASLKALFQGQVRTLIVDHDATVSGFRMGGSGRLTTVASGLKSEGEAAPVADLLDDAIEDALRQRSRVAVIQGSPGFDRLAAILRFRIAPK